MIKQCKELSDQGLHYLHFHPYLLQDLSGCKTDKFEFDNYFEKRCRNI